MGASSEEVKNIVQLCQRAAELNRATAARVGNVIELSDENSESVMITADLHGNCANFAAILEIADLAGHSGRHLVLQEICHGGPTEEDGGCKSFALLEEVVRLKVEFPERVHFLLSNHELAELTDFPILKNQRMLNLAFRSGMRQRYGEATEHVRDGYKAFLASCPLAVRLPGEVFVCHTLPGGQHLDSFDCDIFQRPLTEKDFECQNSLFHLVWGRDYSLRNARQFAKKVGAQVLIHGHDPCPEGFKCPNKLQIILDCSKQPASYLLVPTDRALGHAELLKRVAMLPAGAPDGRAQCQ